MQILWSWTATPMPRPDAVDGQRCTGFCDARFEMHKLGEAMLDPV